MSIFPVSSIQSIYKVELPYFSESNGDLVVMEEFVNVPFTIARVFVVRAGENAIRGQHAHKHCSQFLICSSGSVDVICTDGITTSAFELNHPKIGLYIPPSIWAEQRYRSAGSVLTVLCDHSFDEHDYIREYSDYLLYRQNLLSQEGF